MFDLLDHQMFDLFAWKKKKAELTKIIISLTICDSSAAELEVRSDGLRDKLLPEERMEL